MFGDFSWWIFVLITVVYVFIDGLYALWIYQVAATQPLASSITAGVLALLITFGVISYTSNPLYIIGVVVGSAVGTYVVVSWKLYHNKQNEALKKRQRKQSQNKQDMA
jgi:ABC-type bacteriocin/lantibiotic exporter with double-glycine peptidase domain